MQHDELAEIVENLRVVGADISDVEAKKAEAKLPRSVRETLSSFANTRGGVLILGLDETNGFTATGLVNPAKMSADLASFCATDMEPALRPIIGIHSLEGAQLLVAEVQELDRADKPCFYRGGGITQGSYIRTGDGDHRLSSYEVQLMLANRGQPRWDEEPVPQTGLEDLDPGLVEALLARLRTRRPYAFSGLDASAALRRLKVLVPGDCGEDVASLGGLLALGRFPQEFFPQLMLTFVHYPLIDGPDVVSGARFVDDVVAEGPIPIMVRDALIAIRKNMTRRSFVRGVGREDVWEYPAEALREAIVNALVHRDLSSDSRGAQVQVEMYPDRLVVRNPGGLFGSVTQERLGEEGVTSTRNAALLRILEDVPVPGSERSVCENRGSGIRTMITALRVARMSLPEFRDRLSTFTVTFPNHTLLSDDVVTWISSLGQHGLTESQCVGLALVQEEGFLDNQSYRVGTGVDSRVATQELRDLLDRRLVVQVGTGRWTRYELADAAGSSQAPVRRGDRRAALLAALSGGECSRADLVAHTGLSDGATAHWLRILRREGLIETTGGPVRSRNIRYRLAGQ